jgi:hypothetical protein
MSRFDELAPPKRVSGVPCAWSAMLAELDPDVRASLDAALANRVDWSETRIADTLTNLGHQTDPGSVGRHRRNECAHCRRRAETK